MADFTVKTEVELSCRSGHHHQLFSCRNHSARSSQLVLHLGFAKEGTSVLDMLADCHCLHHFPEGGVIAGVALWMILTLVWLAMLP